MLLSLVGDGPFFLRGLLLQKVPCNAAISVCATGTGVLPKTELAVRLLVEVEVVPSTGLAGLVYLEHPQVLSSILERLCFCSMGSVKSGVTIRSAMAACRGGAARHVQEKAADAWLVEHVVWSSSFGRVFCCRFVPTAART